MTVTKVLSAIGAGLFVGVFTVVGVLATATRDASGETVVAPPPAAEQAAVYAVEFTAEWCGACRVLEARTEHLKARFVGEPVHFVVLDLTDEQRRGQARRTAAALGLEPVLRKYMNATGYTLLVDARSKAVVALITSADEIDEMAAKLRTALVRAG